MEDHVPSSGASSSGAMPSSVRPLRASLEDLDDLISHRSKLLDHARQIASADDIRPQVLQESSRLAHGGTGDVKTEWFEDLFGKSLEKYDSPTKELESEAEAQSKLLERIRVDLFKHAHDTADSKLHRSKIKLSWLSVKTILG